MKAYRAHIISLGCPKNTVDAEAAISLLRRSGCTITSDPRAADILLVNSCSFLDAAWRETLEETERLFHLKRSNGNKKLILMGCLPVHRYNNLEQSLPWVDHIIPSGAHALLPQLIEEWRSSSSKATTCPVDGIYDPFAAYESRDLLTPAHTAYVKVAEGCDRSCSFCAIPVIRGPLSCRRPESILREIEGLLRKGVKEITLIAQDILSYCSSGMKFPDLVTEIVETGVEWIRIFYLHPATLTLETVGRLFERDSVCRYLEVPFQHVSDELLHKMKRSHSRVALEALLSGIHREFPDAVIRSEAIVGFPGETESDFEKLKDFVASGWFASLGIFQFSSEPGTEAARLGDHVPKETVEERTAELSAVQEAASFDFHSRFIGKVLRVLVDRAVSNDEGVFDECDFAGRFYGQAYETDGEVYLKGKNLIPGDFVMARILDAGIYDLMGEVV
ncbi:MAG: 30S ribosomal protein S12 methylthiotransferase RimO [Candidatus Latescibacteria bacterium]|nr:30S ribosomal protein S12 methylthiotransferase RimO [Candidatus Latescibacterota bacterium]NIM20959.1 30S ribosomal protein S12 methylthiotransferase RimO [Candidatus Latescibacterota bacterium]NIM65094.1 30S ribosomal protein S12 methylthiotransferase RimO [Candidatus Latescibacterota bacterium]NIO01609.1 30S ribosomal protein S12 methylthiotransferase RimO [Candidatus Latescibacterota bacterium]NIO28126.1 30S ribosomal protein S12 methylthiotransferase RimO [Candidatus Latescibacterota ba